MAFVISRHGAIVPTDTPGVLRRESKIQHERRDKNGGNPT